MSLLNCAERKCWKGKSPRKKNLKRAARVIQKNPKKPKKRKLTKQEKPTLLDRNVWSQSKYMKFLSIPTPKFSEEPKKKKYKKRCELEPCPPRFVQLAVPNKRRVYANWKEYAHSLPTEMLMRYEEILHTDQNLDPREARYYYKKLDQQRRRELRRKRQLKKKKQKLQEKESDWLQEEIHKLAGDILNYILDEPLFALNYKQMLLSDGILDRLDKTNIMKKPSRKTKNHYKKTMIEVSDKLAIWIDTLTRFVDVQAIESDSDIPPLSIPSLFGEEESEGEGESEYFSSESEGELQDEQLFEKQEEEWGEEEDEGIAQELQEAIMENLFKPGEGEGATDLEDMLNALDEDLLERLIKILSNCSDEFLDSDVDAAKLPGVHFRDILDRLKALRADKGRVGERKSFMERILTDWALRNDPDQVTDDILRKIQEVSGLLGDFGSAIDVSTDRPVTDELTDIKEEVEGELTDTYGPSVFDDQEGGTTSTMGFDTTQPDISGLEGEEEMGMEEEIKKEEIKPEIETILEEGKGFDGKYIRGHKPPKVYEHTPDTVCCLSLKTWAVWLLEITHNAHNWTKWMRCVIQKVKEYAATIRGEVMGEDGKAKTLRKAEWRKFAAETEESIVAWRQYSAHVKELSQSIIDDFHGKKILNCCPKCLEDHLITDVVVAHKTIQALTEAISCAAYWQRCLDALVDKTKCLTADESEEEEQESESDERDDAVIEDLDSKSSSSDSVYEIEGLDEESGESVEKK